MTLHPVILAGGSGTRLWPLSRENHPKQFLPLQGERSLFQDTLSRLDGMAGIAVPVIVCNEAHRFLVGDQMRKLDKRPLEIIVEPAGRNTAPALTLASLRLVEIGEDSSGDPVMLVMPADHVIRDLKAFQMTVGAAVSLAERGHMVTFGVVPDDPETGYGYIRKGESLEDMHDVEGGVGSQPPREGRRVRTSPTRVTAYRVSEFVEKPDMASARAYLESGEYLWNSGIFMMRASVWLSELERRRPDIARACRTAHSNGSVDGHFYRPAAADFIACPSDSIDYAVMEKAVEAVPDVSSRTDRAAPVEPPSCDVVSLDAGWSDVGAWSTLWEERERDSQGNVVQGDVYLHSTENALLVAQHRLLATVGLEDVVVVETGDAVLVARKDRVQDVREIVRRLKADGRTESESHRKVHRPWGTYEIVDAGQGFQVKRLSVNPGGAISLQMHHHRAEHWVVVSGTAKVTKGDQVFLLSENQSAFVPNGVTHRLENPGDGPLEIIEVQSGTYLGEDDIVRLQDDYRRHEQG